MVKIIAPSSPFSKKQSKGLFSGIKKIFIKNKHDDLITTHITSSKEFNTKIDTQSNDDSSDSQINVDSNLNKKSITNQVLNQSNLEPVIPEFKDNTADFDKNKFLEEFKEIDQYFDKLKDIDIEKHAIDEELKQPLANNLHEINNEKHFLDALKEIEQDIQIKDSKPKSLDEIADTKKQDIDKLREALGLVSKESERDLKIKKFKEQLFNESTELITDVDKLEDVKDAVTVSLEDLAKDISLKNSFDAKVSPDKAFVFFDNTKIYSLSELKQKLLLNSDEFFNTYVDEKHNDFANWIRYALGEPELADIINRCKTREELIGVLIELEKKDLLTIINEKQNEFLEQEKHIAQNLSESISKSSQINQELNKIENEKKEISQTESELEKLKTDYKIKLKQLEVKQQELDKLIIKNQNLNKELESKLNELNIKIKQKYDELKKEFDTAMHLREKELKTAENEFLKHVEQDNKNIDEFRQKLLKENQDFKKKLEEDYLKKKNDLEKEFNSRFIELEKSFEDKKKFLEEQYSEKQQRLEQEKIDFRNEQREINDLYNSKLKELHVEEEKIYGLQRELKKQELKLISKENELQNKLNELSRKIIESKEIDSKIQQDINKNKETLLKIKQEQAELDNKRLELEKKGFEMYLKEKLNELKESKFKKPEKLNVLKNKEIYRLIDLCRKQINASELNKAQETYSKIRELFYTLNVDEEEKDMLFNTIKELYADINIKLIS